MIEKILLKILHQIDPEVAHHLMIKIFSLFPFIARLGKIKFKIKDFDNPFSNNPLTLAAGFDKNAKAMNFFDQLGFGAIEIGTVTLKPQAGNIKPRIQRILPYSLLNWMGFPNDGSAIILERVKKYKGVAKLGVNIGLNKNTSHQDAADEYKKLYEMFAPYSNYITVNISSPNTKGLRLLQNEAQLEKILKSITDSRLVFKTPILVKISPDESNQTYSSLFNLIRRFEINGIIATNTTSNHLYPAGGLSGEALNSQSQKIWQMALKEFKDNPSIHVIASGGFSTQDHFFNFFQSNGKVVHIYTGLVYQGSSILKSCFEAYLSYNKSKSSL